MKIKTIATVALVALLAYLVGHQIGAGRPAEPAPARAADSAAPAGSIEALRGDNARLQTEVEGLNSEIARLNAANAGLTARQAAPLPPAPAVALQGPTLGLARWEVQQATLNNLRQIDAARKQHALEKGQSAGSITELVGRQRYIKTVRSVDGEDYSTLSMNPADPLTVTTPDGIRVTYDPTGATTTRPDFPPEVLHVRELTAKLQPSVNEALKAYRAANNGQLPPNEQAVVPYFATPQEGADFVELTEAKKAAGL